MAAVVNTTASMRVASLFSGCGGFDVGFETEGFQPVAAFDINAAAVSTFVRNIGPVAHISDLSCETPQINCDVLLAGSPCQGFSTSGKRDPNDPRNSLLVRAGMIALAVRPKVFVMENVPAAISGRQGSRWELVEAMLTDHGYNVRRVVADGPVSGVPQIRRRLFLIAWRGSPHVQCEPAPRTAPPLRLALENLPEAPCHTPAPFLPGTREHLIALHIASGQKLSNVRKSNTAVHTWHIPEVFGATSLGEQQVLNAVLRLRRRERRRTFGDADPVEPKRVCAYLERDCLSEIFHLVKLGYLREVDEFIDLRHTYNGKFRRLSYDAPSPTVDTHFGDPGLFLHPQEHRGLTTREAARIQGFKDRFDFGAAVRPAFRMIGNAVPPPMAARLAGFIRDALLPVTA